MSEYYVYAGQTSTGIVLSNYYDYMYVLSKGTANSTTVSNGGKMYVSSGGMTSNTMVVYYGSMYVSSGGVANGTTVNSNGYLHVSSGGVVNNTAVNDWSRIYVSSGGVIKNATVNSTGCISVDFGASACGITVNKTGSMYVEYGAIVSAVKENGGCVDVENGARVTFVSNTFSNLTLNSYDEATVHSGTTAVKTTVNSNGELSVFSGGKANSTAVNSDGRMYVSSSGMAKNATVNKGGKLYVCDYGSATLVKENGGYVDVDDEAKVTFASHTLSGLVLEDYNSASVHSGTRFVNATVDSDGELYVFSSGNANGTTICGGSMYISSGGTANKTKVTGKYTSSYYWKNGYLTVSDGGKLNETTVDAYGELYIRSGGSATLVKENGGYVDVDDDAVVSFSTNNLSGLVLSENCSATLHSGTTAEKTTVNKDAALYIFSGGIAKNTTLNGSSYDHGKLTVYSGGLAKTTTIRAGGYLTVSNGGTADGIKLYAYGDLTVSSGGKAVITGGKPGDGSIDVEEGATVAFSWASAYSGCYIGSSGVCISSAVRMNSKELSSAVSMFIVRGGVANSTTINEYGDLYVCSGGVANKTIVNHRGKIYVAGGKASNTTVNYGSMYIHSGGLANGTTVNSYGGMFVCAKGTANSTRIDSGGDMIVYSDGIASNTMVNSAGDIYISSGGVANGTTVNSGGDLYVSSGGIANSTTVSSGGDLYVSSGGIANSTTVSSGGGMHISSGGTIKNTTISSGGCVYCYGTIGGNLQVESGAYVCAYGSIDFTVAEQTDKQKALINNWSLLRVYGYGTDCTITVKAYQASGTYMLACEASGFDKTVTVKTTTGTELGNLSVGEKKSFNGTSYALTKNTGNLALSIVAAQRAPDLAVSSLKSSASTITFGSSVKLSFTIKNGGSLTAGASTAYVYNGTKKIGTVAVAALAAGKSKAYSYTVASKYLAAGKNTLKIVADGANKVKESNEKNNSKTCSLTVKAADLTVSSLKSSASTVNLGSSVKLSFTIKNGGTLTAGASTAYVYSGSTKVGTVAVVALAAGKSKAYSYTVASKYLASGKNTLKIVADGANKVKESNESNNSKTYSLTVKAADLTVSSLKSSASTVNLGSSVKLSFTIKNGGSLTAGASTAYVYSGSTKVGTVAVAALAAGKSKAYSYTVASKYLAADKNTLKILADGANKVKESNESNNSKTCSITVKAADLTISSLKPSASTVKLGSSVKLSFTIKNGGSLTAGASTAYVYSGSKKIGSLAVAALAAGKSKAYSYTVASKYLVSGKNTLKIVADGAKKVKEGNESNNTKTCTVTTSTTLTGTSGNDVFASGNSNDTIKGKGGDDIVCFGSNWGSDTVEQLDADEVTLWFKSGSLSNWNNSTRTYTSGSNSVKVSGKSEVNLKFGDDGSTLYDQLVAAGAFSTSNSKIIGTCSNGILATV